MEKLNVFQCISIGDITGVKRLLLEYPHVLSERDGTNQPVLMYAVRKKNLEIATFLVEHGAQVDARDNNGSTALLVAVEQQHGLEIVRLLVRHGADVNVRNSGGWTPLLNACKWDRTETVRFLLANGADYHSASKAGWSALALTAEYGHLETTRELLLCENIDVNSVDVKGCTPLMNASRRGYLEIARALVDKGASLDLQDVEGHTALMRACENGWVEVVCLLVEREANLTLVENMHGYSALDIAIRSGKHEKIPALLEFVLHSDVANILQAELGLSPSVTVAFFRSQRLTVEDCRRLAENDLEWLGIRSKSLRLQALQAFQATTCTIL